MKKNSVPEETDKKADRLIKDNAGNDRRREISDRELSADVNLINPELDSLGSRG